MDKERPPSPSLPRSAVEGVLIDCGYLHPEFAAAYLLVDGGEAAFIETNTSHAVPRLLAALDEHGLAPELVRYVVITHVHLDHAGGASALMARCKNATLLAHPRAAKHASDPSRLVASAKQVYGEARFAELYGRVDPIDPARVRSIADGESVPLGSRTLSFFHARGHANHHLCVRDQATGAVFTGDAFGLRYPALQRGGLFILPSTSPTDFDAGEARSAVRRIAHEATSAYLTHFGRVDELASAADQLLVHLDASEAIVERAAASDLADEALDDFCEKNIRAHYRSFVAATGLELGPREWAPLDLDLELNGQGLAHAARRRRAH